jgi:cytochrome c553
MKKIAIALAGLCIGGTAMAAASLGPVPYWAYPVAAPSKVKPPRPDTVVKHHLPGSTAAFTEAGVNDRFNVPDWYPQDHPKAPGVILHGHKPGTWACGYCHLPNGQGRPENAPLAGQPADYLIAQVKLMQSGARKTSEPRMGSIQAMYKIAKAVSDEDLKTAAAYFSSLHYKKWIRVVEVDWAPVTKVSSHSMLVPEGRWREKLGNRIIEMPEDLDRIELRDARTGFVAFVPKGSIARGKKLVESGAGAFPCAACHGPDYKGNGSIPALAGRSPSYLVRQLYDFQHGSRGGPGADMMRPETVNLDYSKRVDIAAYLASLSP